MTFLWPSMLLTLLVLPVLVLLYVRVQNRRRVLAGTFHTIGGSQVTRRAPGFRRHLPPLIFLLSLAILLFALARPQATVSLPRVEGTVMLVFDVSASMAATDIEPSRMEAAKAAAREFVTGQPETVKIGIVSFSGSGFTVQMPTNDTHELLSAIDRLQPTHGTSLGQGMANALHTLAVDAGLVTDEANADASASGGEGGAGQPAPDAAQSARPPRENLLAQLPEGTYAASVIVLLSDGEDNQSIDPLEAAQAASEHGVPVHALGFGTPAGTTLELDGFSVHTALDEGLLQQITSSAGGQYYPGTGEQGQGGRDAKQVYAGLTPQLVVKPEAMEVTSVFAGAGIALLLAGSLFSLLWFNRLL